MEAGSARRANARNYAVYLQRRVEDYGDPSQPHPKWTALDREAVQELVREFRRLDRCYEIAVQQIREHGLVERLPDDDGSLGYSAWDHIPLPPTPRKPWYRFWKR